MADGKDLTGTAFETRTVHGGGGPDPATGAVTTPVYLSSTFVQDAVGVDRGYEYARSGNPSRASLESHLALLEEAEFGFAFASGMAAEDAVMRLLDPGDHLVMPTDSYGGTYRLATRSTAGPGWPSTPRTCPPSTRRCGPRRGWSGSRHRRTPARHRRHRGRGRAGP